MRCFRFPSNCLPYPGTVISVIHNEKETYTYEVCGNSDLLFSRINYDFEYTSHKCLNLGSFALMIRAFNLALEL